MFTVLSCHGWGRRGSGSFLTAVASMAVLIVSPIGATAGEPFRFDAETKTLTVNTGRLELTILGGAAAAVRDLQTGEVFGADANWPDLAKASTGAICGQEPAAAKRLGTAATTVARKPQASSPVEFQQPEPARRRADLHGVERQHGHVLRPGRDAA